MVYYNQNQNSKNNFPIDFYYEIYPVKILFGPKRITAQISCINPKQKGRANYGAA